MPIYAYRCNECGFTQDVLQKLSDQVLTVCPSCGKPELKKQVTAAGFQLKGSGWYATDFRGSDKTPATSAAAKSESSQPDTTSVENSTGNAGASGTPGAASTVEATKTSTSPDKN